MATNLPPLPELSDEVGTKNSAWLEAVGSIDQCVLCGRWGIQVAHRNKGKGKGLKNPDHLTAAICPDCHHEIDNGKTLTREERRARMDEAIVLTLDALVRSGKVKVAA
jgi:uncharacterized protein YlaI